YWRSHSFILPATLTPIGCAERQRIVLPLDELRRESQESQSGLKLVQGIIRAGDLKRRQESRQIANRGQIFERAEFQISDSCLASLPAGKLLVDVTLERREVFGQVAIRAAR